MFDMITDIMESLANLKTIIGLGGGGLAVLSTLGAVPKVGAGRALTLHLKSILTSASPFSIRSKEINYLRSNLKALRKGHYLVVTGGKGLGKTCLINSVLHRYGGVVTISVRFFFFKHAFKCTNSYFICFLSFSFCLGQIRRG
jgi:hypothetical protein